ncbi:MAG: DMT family transporter [Firmicutes bacterium]|nr:DMT family transporter [Bacillota bacterium]
MIVALVTAALGHIIWGFSYIFAKVGLEQTVPEVFLSCRFTLSLLFMTIPILMGRQKFCLFDGRNLKPLLIFAMTEPLCFFFESYGLLYTNATFAGAFVAIVPVVSILTGIVFLKEYPTRRQAFFCLFPVVGVIIMTVSGKSLGILSAIGVIFLLCNCFASAAYKTFNRKASAEFSAFERTYVILFFSAAAFTLASFVKLDHPLQAYRDALCNPEILVLLIFLALISSILCNMLVNHAAAHLTVAQLATLGTLTTLTSMAAGIIFLKEPYSLAFFMGAALILFGIWQVTRPAKKKEK